MVELVRSMMLEHEAVVGSSDPSQLHVELAAVVGKFALQEVADSLDMQLAVVQEVVEDTGCLVVVVEHSWVVADRLA
jgi:hypothetical protein